jgi:hypothetical protein
VEWGHVDFRSIWPASLPLKIRAFLFLVKIRKVLTLEKVEKEGDTTLIFCTEEETVENFLLVLMLRLSGLGLQILIN